MAKKRIKENNIIKGHFSIDGEYGAELCLEFSPDSITLNVGGGSLGHYTIPTIIDTPISVHKALEKRMFRVGNGIVNKKDENKLHVILEEYMRRKRMYEGENKRENAYKYILFRVNKA